MHKHRLKTIPSLIYILVSVGVIISAMSRRIKDFGLKPTMYCAFGLGIVILTMMVAAVPKWATMKLSDEPAWLIQPR